MPQKFERVYDKTEFGLTADVTCPPLKYTKFAEVSVPPQQQITFGVGGIVGGVDTRAVCQVKLANTSNVEIVGKIRFVLSDANEINKIVVAEQRTNKTSTTATDRNTGFLLGEFPTKAREDSKLLLEYLPDGASTLYIGFDQANTILLVPVTVYMAGIR